MAGLVRSAALLGLGLGLALGTIAQDRLPTGPIQPRPGEGWTKDDVARERPLPRLDRIDATVVKFATSKTGRFIVTLDNGTRWTQIEDRGEARVSVGDLIVLRKNTLGSYTLQTKDGVSTRVSRNR